MITDDGWPVTDHDTDSHTGTDTDTDTDTATKIGSNVNAKMVVLLETLK